MPQMVYVNPRHSLHGKQSTLLQNRPLLQAICPGSLWVRDNRWLLSRVRWLAGPAGGQGPFVLVGATNRDKRPPFCPGWCHQPGQKAPIPPAGPASRWIRDKSHLLSRTQRLPGQMAWNKGLFCSSEYFSLVSDLILQIIGILSRPRTFSNIF